MISFRNLEKAFGPKRVLDGVSFDVEDGEVFFIIGGSGVGKSVLIKHLIGLLRPDAGEIWLDDAEISRLPEEGMYPIRRKCAMVFQHYNLFPHMTVLENVIEGPVRVRRRPEAEAVAAAEKLLARVGLGDKRDAYPFRLSGGQQQRVGIVRALMMRPDVLLFDEPTSALDPELVGDVLAVMRELSDEGWTMLIVTHELAFAREVADQVVFMDQGVVVEHGPPTDVLVSPRHERTRQFVRRLQNRF